MNGIEKLVKNVYTYVYLNAIRKYIHLKERRNIKWERK